MVATVTEQEPAAMHDKPRRWPGRAVRVALCGLIVVGVFGLISDRRKLHLLEQRAEELSLIVGELEVSDPSRIHIKLIDAVADDHLLWRIYLPPHQSLRLSHDFLGSGSGWSSYSNSDEATNDLLRWRLEGPDESTRVHILSGRGPSTSSIAPRTAKFLRTYWSELDIDIAGDNGGEVFPVDQIRPLVTVDVPDHLASVAEEQLGGYTWKQLQEQPLMQVEIGTAAAFEEREAEQQKASSP